MCADLQRPNRLRSVPATTLSWQERATVAYPLLAALALLAVMRGWLGPRPLNGDFTIYWSWADQFASQLSGGQPYPRWLPHANGGLGTPVFYYYPPIAFYLTAAFELSGFSTYASLISCHGLAFLASGIACWHWLRGRSNQPLLGAAFFVAAPYHLFNYSDRGALAESVATAIIPLLAIGLRRIADKRGGVIFTAFAYAAMIATHLPLALLASVFLIAPYGLAHRDRLAQFAIAILAGIAASGIYLVPALALQSFRDVGQLYRTANLQTAYWSVFSQNWGDVAFTATFLVVGAVLIAAFMPAIVRRDRWAIHALGMAILISGVIPFLWSLPLLRDIQFPFRALALAEFSLATALARLPRKLSPALILGASPLILSLLFLRGFHAGDHDLNWLRNMHPDAYEYLPKGVMAPGQTSATLSDVLTSRVPPPAVSGMVVEPHFYFPSWSCGTIEPRTQLLVHEPDCRPRIVWTTAERIGAALSAAALLFLSAFAAARRKLLPAR